MKVQVILETVAGLVGVGESGVKRSSPVVLDLILNSLGHLAALLDLATDLGLFFTSNVSLPPIMQQGNWNCILHYLFRI